MSGTTLKLAWRPHSITVRAYCKCGDIIHCTVSPVGQIEYILEDFARDHLRPGCEPCDAKTAQKARRKLEREGQERLL